MPLVLLPALPSIPQLAGLLAVNVAVSWGCSVIVVGVIVCAGSYSSSSGTFDLTYDSTYANNPPPGFYQTPVRMVVSGSSWAQGVN